MAFNKTDAKEARECFTAIMAAFPKKKVAEFFGEFNQLALFLDDALRAAPEEKP